MFMLCGSNVLRKNIAFWNVLRNLRFGRKQVTICDVEVFPNRLVFFFLGRLLCFTPVNSFVTSLFLEMTLYRS